MKKFLRGRKVSQWVKKFSRREKFLTKGKVSQQKSFSMSNCYKINPEENGQVKKQK